MDILPFRIYHLEEVFKRNSKNIKGQNKEIAVLEKTSKTIGEIKIKINLLTKKELPLDLITLHITPPLIILLATTLTTITIIHLIKLSLSIHPNSFPFLNVIRQVSVRLQIDNKKLVRSM